MINVLVWVAQLIFDHRMSPVFTGLGYEGGFTSMIALWPINNENFRPWQIVTHMFAHAASGEFMIWHILFNMFALWMFGRVIENLWGAKRFLIFYMACGLGAAAAQLLTSSGMSMAVGASGAVFGVLIAFAMTFPNTELYLMFIPIPIKAKWAILGLIAIDLFSGISQLNDGIAHFAHLGGALTGFILLKIWNKTNRRTLY